MHVCVHVCVSTNHFMLLNKYFNIQGKVFINNNLDMCIYIIQGKKCTKDDQIGTETNIKFSLRIV